jgi:sugar phosphate isomerase/epimerase
MSIGLGTYSFFWRHSSRVADPLDLAGMFEATAALDVDVFQICDYPQLETLPDNELTDLATIATHLGLNLEVGFRGIRAWQLENYLRIARLLDVRLVRSMLFTATDRPSFAEAQDELVDAIPAYEAAGVTLALETYEQVSTFELADLIESVDSTHLGICLDVANVIARLENQRDVIERVAPLIKNVHVKDFQFVRAPGLIGFELVGSALGEGLLELDHLMATLGPDTSEISRIVEHWLPWQGSERDTIQTEEAWTAQSVELLRALREVHKSTG